jgi:hypothetical protein
MEARIACYQPVGVGHEAATLAGAISAGAEKLERSLDHTFGKLGNKKGLTCHGGHQTIRAGGHLARPHVELGSWPGAG